VPFAVPFPVPSDLETGLDTPKELLQLARESLNVTVTLLICDKVTVPEALATDEMPKTPATTIAVNITGLKKMFLLIFEE
jgi:hypothetical protein